MVLRLVIALFGFMAVVDGITMTLSMWAGRPFIESELISIHWAISFLGFVILSELRKWRRL